VLRVFFEGKYKNSIFVKKKSSCIFWKFFKEQIKKYNPLQWELEIRANLRFEPLFLILTFFLKFGFLFNETKPLQ
jgi:hypothetical protein